MCHLSLWTDELTDELGFVIPKALAHFVVVYTLKINLIFCVLVFFVCILSLLFCLFVYLFECLCVWLLVLCLLVCLGLNVWVWMFVWMFVCLFVRSFVCLYVCMYVWMFASLGASMSILIIDPHATRHSPTLSSTPLLTSGKLSIFLLGLRGCKIQPLNSRKRCGH